MKKNALLAVIIIAALASTMAHAGGQHGRNRYKPTKVNQSYYPLQPRYPHSPIQRTKPNGLLGDVLGYEIAKDPLTSGLSASPVDFLGRQLSKKH